MKKFSPLIAFSAFQFFLFFPKYPVPLNVHKGYDNGLMGRRENFISSAQAESMLAFKVCRGY